MQLDGCVPLSCCYKRGCVGPSQWRFPTAREASTLGSADEGLTLTADHKKARAVMGHVVFGSPVVRRGGVVVPAEKRAGDSNKLESGVSGDIHGQERTTMVPWRQKKP